MYETLHFEVDEKKIGLLTLDVPGKLNAHTMKMRQEMLHFWKERQNGEEECRVIIMTGAGRAFCSGSDVDEMADEHSAFYKQNIENVYRFQAQLAEVIFLMRRAPQPIIGAVRGWAAGGGFSFALATDIRVVDPTAKFVASYINVGLGGADMGSSFHFPRQVSLGFAAEYLYTGEPLDAETAYRIGLVNYLVPPEQLMPKARELAEKMVTKSVLGLRMTKEALNQNIGIASLESALQLENRNQVIGLGSRPIVNPLKNKGK
jgi:enoyl-CoA hydratase/carnithine racemase